jgi:hypothetical protein
MLTALAVLTLTYWVQPAHTADDDELAVWALEDWSRASGGRLTWKRVGKPEDARIRIRWVDEGSGPYGEARGGDVFVSLGMAATSDRLLRDTVLYLTCLHESGHALGLRHTAAFADIMYNFQYGGDITEYFGRYRRRVKSRRDFASTSGVSTADQAALITALAVLAP